MHLGNSNRLYELCAKRFLHKKYRWERDFVFTTFKMEIFIFLKKNSLTHTKN
jgi:hypothetical protein